MTDYECYNCKGDGGIYVDGKFSDVCEVCNGKGYTNTYLEDE